VNVGFALEEIREMTFDEMLAFVDLAGDLKKGQSPFRKSVKKMVRNQG